MDKINPTWDADAQEFLRYWFAGLERGLAEIDAPARTTLLRACGQACADSYTAAVFADARQHSAGLPGFLHRLGENFPEARYDLLAPGQIEVRIQRCACDLVLRGRVRSPLLCECSLYNLKANFERALGQPVSVQMEASILQGAPECVFLVSLGEESGS
jgi:predicted ArsR family transcriptional regulator